MDKYNNTDNPDFNSNLYKQKNLLQISSAMGYLRRSGMITHLSYRCTNAVRDVYTNVTDCPFCFFASSLQMKGSVSVNVLWRVAGKSFQSKNGIKFHI